MCRGAGSRGSERETRRHERAREGTGEARDDERDVNAKVHERENERDTWLQRERATHESERESTHARDVAQGVPLI